MEENKEKKNKNLLVLGIIAVGIALATTVVSLVVYHNSGDIYLDRSRPGFLPSEDEVKDLEDELQKATDKFVKDIDKAVEEKAQDILKV